MSLTKKVYLTISGYDIKLSDNLMFYQKDQLKLIFYINEYGIDYGNNATTRALMPVNPLNAILFIENPDGVDSVSSARIEDNAVTFYLDSTHTQYVGVSRMQLRLFDQDGCAITLPHFTFEIRENIYGSGDVRFQNVVMVDHTGTVILTEDNDMLDVGDILTMGTEVAYPQVAKTIKDLPIKHGLDGTEKLIVEDNEATKQAPLTTIVDEIKQNSQEKIREIESELAQTNAQLSEVKTSLNRYINVLDAGGHTCEEKGYENYDNHDIIMECINQLDDGGIIYFNRGTYKTSQLDLTLINKDIQFVGEVACANTYQTHRNAMVITSIKSLNSSEYLIKNVDVNNPTEKQNALVLKNIMLDGDNKANYCVNGNYNLIIDNCVITNAVVDGCVLENYSYPVFIKNSSLSFNGRHGLLIKGNKTTVVNFHDTEFYWNGGYGAYVEGCAGLKLQNALFQSNKVGGLKIFKDNDKYETPYYVTNIHLDDVYFEANGRLESTHNDYDGNYAIFLGSSDETSGNVNRMIKNVRIDGGSLNASKNGKSLRIGGVYGCKINSDGISNSNIDIVNVNYGIEFLTAPTKSSFIDIENEKAISSYFKHNYARGIVYNGGLFFKRGHNQKILFGITSDEMAHVGAQTKNVKPIQKIDSNAAGYPIKSDSSLVSLELRKLANKPDGEVTVILRHYYEETGLGISGAYKELARFTVDYSNQTELNKLIEFDIDSIRFVGGTLGVIMQTSSDYSAIAGWTNSYEVIVEIED